MVHGSKGFKWAIWSLSFRKISLKTLSWLIKRSWSSVPMLLKEFIVLFIAVMFLGNKIRSRLHCRLFEFFNISFPVNQKSDIRIWRMKFVKERCKEGYRGSVGESYRDNLSYHCEKSLEEHVLEVQNLQNHFHWLGQVSCWGWTSWSQSSENLEDYCCILQELLATPHGIFSNRDLDLF